MRCTKSYIFISIQNLNWENLNHVNAKIEYNKQNNHIRITTYEIRGKIKLPDCGPLISNYIKIAKARIKLQLFTKER